jgi:hypothetical protein
MTPRALTPAELRGALATATTGLLFPSESDSPLTPYTWTAQGVAPPSPEALREALGRPPETRVEIEEAEDFFEGLTEPRRGATAEEKAEAARFRALARLLEQQLTDLRVYRVGEVDVDIYLLGHHPSGAWLGLRTHAVET